MMPYVSIINLHLPFRMGHVNCYLIETAAGCVLIDTGGANNRRELVQELERAGCGTGRLRLILLTHGDFDHTGNAAYLRGVFGCKVAMHADDAGMVERGDMFINRKKPNFLIRMLVPFFIKFGSAEVFVPDLLVGDETDLCEFGFDARIVSIPGHSKGSIGILTTGGDFFCGDLFENTKEPVLNSLMDDPAAARMSLQKLYRIKIDTVFPGHGMPFAMQSFREANP